MSILLSLLIVWWLVILIEAFKWIIFLLALFVFSLFVLSLDLINIVRSLSFFCFAIFSLTLSWVFLLGFICFVYLHEYRSFSFAKKPPVVLYRFCLGCFNCPSLLWYFLSSILCRKFFALVVFHHLFNRAQPSVLLACLFFQPLSSFFLIFCFLFFWSPFGNLKRISSYTLFGMLHFFMCLSV